MKIGDFTLPTTAWQSDINLDYDTAYYWQVRASSANSHSACSAVGTFTTESPPSELSSPSELPSPPSLHILSPLSPSRQPSSPFQSSSTSSPPPPMAQQTIPDWIIYLSGALLLTTILLLIILLTLVVRIKQL